MFSKQAQLPTSKPFNYLNPNTKIGLAPLVNGAGGSTVLRGRVPSQDQLSSVETNATASKSITTTMAKANTRPQEEWKVAETDQDLNGRTGAEQFERADEEAKRGLTPRTNQQSDSSYNAMALTNMQDQFMEIMNNEQVEDIIDLNEKFLAMALGGIEVSELALLPKLELRVDTTCHSLQVTGEILPSLEYLKLNDSIVRSFRDLGTSFKNVRVLHIARCEIKEVQGIQAFEQLEELYISYNAIEELFDVSWAEHLQILDFEGNNVKEVEQLKYLRRMHRLEDVNFRHNPVVKESEYYQKLAEVVPKLQVLDDEPIGDNLELFVAEKQTESQQQLMLTREEVDLLEQALQSVLAQFEKIGLRREDLPSIGEVEAESKTVVEKMVLEPDNEALLVSRVKT